jgi:hypothetical protein
MNDIEVLTKILKDKLDERNTLTKNIDNEITSLGMTIQKLKDSQDKQTYDNCKRFFTIRCTRKNHDRTPDYKTGLFSSRENAETHTFDGEYIDDYSHYWKLQVEEISRYCIEEFGGIKNLDKPPQDLPD